LIGSRRVFEGVAPVPVDAGIAWGDAAYGIVGHQFAPRRCDHSPNQPARARTPMPDLDRSALIGDARIEQDERDD